MSKQSDRLDNYRHILLDLKRRYTEKRFTAVSNLGRRYGYMRISASSILKANQDLLKLHQPVFNTQRELEDCLAVFAEETESKRLIESRKYNDNAFKLAKANRQYVAEHHFDKPFDLKQMGLGYGSVRI